MGFEQVLADTFEKTTDNMTYRTLLAGGIYPTDLFQGYLAIYYLNPLDESTAAHHEEFSAGTTTRRNREISTTSTVGGIAMGYAPNEELGYGLSGGVGFDIRDIYDTLTTQSTGASSLQYTRTQIKYYYLMLTPGILWRPHPRWNVGLTLNWKPFAFFNDGNVYSTRQSSAGADLSENVLNFDPDIHDDIAASFGQKFMIGDRDMILLDLSYDPKFSFLNQSQEKFEVANYKSLSAGWQHKANDFLDLLGGYGYYDSSNNKSYLITAGFVINRPKNNFILGLYYKNVAAKSDGVGQAITAGFMFSSDVSYY